MTDVFSGTGHVFDYALTPGMETLSVCCASMGRMASMGARPGGSGQIMARGERGGSFISHQTPRAAAPSVVPAADSHSPVEKTVF